MSIKNIFEQALGNFSKGLYHKALSEFHEVVSLDNTDEHTFAEMSKKLSLECYKLIAIKYISKDMFKKALEYIQSGLDEFHGDISLYFYKGIAENNSLNFAQSLKTFNIIFEKQPDYPHIKILLSIVLLNMGHYNEVENMLSNLIDLPPHDATLFHLLGITKFRLNKHQESLELFKKALELKKPFPEAELSLLALYLTLKKYNEALIVLKNLLEFYKNKSLLKIPSSFLAAKMRKEKEISKYIKDINNLNTSESESLKWADNHFYGTVQIDVLSLPFQNIEGELVQNSWFRKILINLYQKFLNKGIDLPELYFRIGREMQRLKNFSEAIDYFTKCLEKNPEFLPARISLAFCYKDIGNIEIAISIFESIHSQYDKMAETILKATELTLKNSLEPLSREDLENEMNILELALKQNPHFADIYYNIGRLHFLLDEPEKAITYFEKACVLNPDFIRANIGKAVALMQLNKTGQSRKILNNLSTNKKLYSKILYNLSQLYIQRGYNQKAIFILKELSGLDTELSSIAGTLLQSLSSH